MAVCDSRICGSRNKSAGGSPSLPSNRHSLRAALTVANAREVLALTERRYELGLTNAAVLLDAQRRLTAARSALISVRRTELENRIDLHLALGGEITLEDES